MKINYLTWLRNRVGRSVDEIDLPNNVKTISDLLDFLENQGNTYRSAFSERSLIYISRDNCLCGHDEEVTNVDEISIFSPIVGG